MDGSVLGPKLAGENPLQQRGAKRDITSGQVVFALCIQ